MQRVRRAVIDVGTNSVKLLVAEMEGHVVIPILEESEQTRLGRGFYETRCLQAEAIAQTAEAAGKFAALAAQCEVSAPRIIATSAARDAINQAELLAALKQASGLDAEIISGEQEAELVFQGVTTDPNLEGQRLLILDVGGGSTEFILGEGGHHSFSQSFDLGSVRLLERLNPADPPSLADLAGCRGWLLDFFSQRIAPALQTILGDVTRREARLVGTGGTTTILARMQKQLETFDREQIEGTRLTRAEVLNQMVHLWSLPLAARKKIIGLPAKRADIILMGVAIYEAVMEHLHFPEVYVSTRGLRYGAVLENKEQRV